MRLPTATGFRGEIPAAAADKLPDGYAQVAVNAYVFTGSLDAWNDLASRGVIPKGGELHDEIELSADVVGVKRTTGTSIGHARSAVASGTHIRVQLKR